ncbi:MAG: histidine--tRNA ligase [Lachnospiraceae bacterium]|nr:histidine--tRNA ligase [Lachnospiraceae bacterium]
MALNKNAVTGMRDISPREMILRDYVIGLIKETYKSFGYTPIETPVVESLGNLLSKQGGDNEKLIFKVLKRGEKLKISEAKTEDDLADSGLRYDLTVPLVRYYSAHNGELPKPFKALQVGPVFRADRPQKGRFRQFYQCDIDILGEGSSAAEIDLLLATSTLLGRLGFSGFILHINDRRLLKAMAAYCGIAPERCDEAFIIWDKMDKIGLDGVLKEMGENGFSDETVAAYEKLSAALQNAEEPLKALSELLAEQEGVSAYTAGLETIIRSVEQAASVPFTVKFDPTLVRGMSYYTGPIFELELADFGSAAGGGGRYDEMVGKFIGQQVPACGISIGFERLITILMDQNYQVPGAPRKKAYLLEKNLPEEQALAVRKQAAQERADGLTVLVSPMIKNKKFQKEQLAAEGYTEIEEVYNR